MQVGDIIDIMVDRPHGSPFLIGEKVIIYQIYPTLIYVYKNGNLGAYAFPIPDEGVTYKVLNTTFLPVHIQQNTWKFKIADRLLSSKGIKYTIFDIDFNNHKYFIEDVTNGGKSWIDQSAIESYCTLDSNYHWNVSASPTPFNVTLPVAQPQPSRAFVIPLFSLDPAYPDSSSNRDNMQVNIPSKCKHDWRDSRSEGSTKWCSICGDRK